MGHGPFHRSCYTVLHTHTPLYESSCEHSEIFAASFPHCRVPRRVTAFATVKNSRYNFYNKQFLLRVG